MIRKDKFSFRRLLREKKNRRRNFLFWWRLASEMNEYGNKRQKRVAESLSNMIKSKFAADIDLEARIGPGLHIPHHTGVVITYSARIGANFTIRQNTTIGVVQGMTDNDFIRIGDNVDIGANSCLVGSITIGDNVVIGAMSFVNKDIPSDTIFITRKQSVMTPRGNDFVPMLPRTSHKRQARSK